MKRIIATVVLLSLAAITTVAASGQSSAKEAATQNEPTNQTATMPPADTAAFLTLNLEAGYPLDPFLVSVNGGGDVDASTLADGCVGYIAQDPTIAVNWRGESDFVEAFFYSDHDPTLVVQTPEGDYLCNDDANDLLLDPVVQIDNPSDGLYRIWVGSFDAEQLLPGVLVLTTRPEINIGTFALKGLVQRDPLPEDILEHHEIDAVDVVTALAARRAQRSVTAPIESAPITETVVVSGVVPAFDIATPGIQCNGFIEPDPTFTFQWGENEELLRIFFESETDATLFVAGPDDIIFCNDDFVAGENTQPLVDITEPAAGTYHVFVGRLDVETPIEGVLTVGASADATPNAIESEQD